jgi:Pyruvate/2-oxoacid:ferredoxin oxidoreductase delta subunit
MSSFEQFINKFHVPEEGLPIIEKLVRPDEISFLAALEKDNFTLADAIEALWKSTGEKLSEAQAEEYLRDEYRRGILSLEDETYTRYRIGEFDTRLDIFVTTERGSYREFPSEVRAAVDHWYFEMYLSRLGDSPCPTGDRVVPLQEALDYVDAIERQIWFQNCDCRPLAGHCDKPVDTCLSFRNGINTMAHRGLSKPITKEEAKDVIRRANKTGLMQTMNGNGMCNCCGDCCYLFRAQKARSYGLAWPSADQVAEFHEELCVSCRRCVKRCHFGAFSFEDGGIHFHSEQCRGCALCTQTCPTGAITMRRRA